VNRPLSPGSASLFQRKPKPARTCTVGRVVMNVTKRSDQAIALRRCPARTRWIDGLCSVAEIFQNSLDDCGFLDAGDDAQPTAALAAGLDVDVEHPLEALCSGHRLLSASGRGLAALGGSDGTVPPINAVEQEQVETDIAIERAAEALYRRHLPGHRACARPAGI
jgi:hypothetical protein